MSDSRFRSVPAHEEVPRDPAAGSAWADLIAGFQVSLIALPLCLGISMASGYPPVAGILTAIIGGMITPLFSNSELTIKGPAAGLIVIALGAVTELGQGDPLRGYRLALGVGVAAGVIQIAFGLLRAGRLSEFFPMSAVHGMLAAIGILIASKQLHTLLGVKPHATGPLALIAEIPASVAAMNPAVAFIGGLALLILFVAPHLKWRVAKLVPAPMLVILVSIPLSRLFDLGHEHTYSIASGTWPLGPGFLVDAPSLTSLTLPDFAGLLTATGVKYVIMFALVGTLESVLSAKAIDLLDPWRRKTDFDRDLVGVGVANTLAAVVGGLPMISEIVRSSANIGYGARTRRANACHGLFLLVCVATLPFVIHQIPLAALAAMLIYTGCRLASPREFAKTYEVGAEQFAVFLTTIVLTLAEDLLVGIFAGILLELLLHVVRGGIPMKAAFWPTLDIRLQADGTVLIQAGEAAVFTNWLRLKSLLESEGLHAKRGVVLDLEAARLVDHTVMEKLHEMEREFAGNSLELRVTGLESKVPASAHPRAARRRSRTL